MPDPAASVRPVGAASPAQPALIDDALRAALDATTAGIAVWGPDRTLSYANRAYRNAFDIAHDAAGRLAYEEFLRKVAASGEVADTGLADWCAAEAAAFGAERQVQQRMADGRMLEIDSRPTGDGGMTVTLHDISAQKATEAALRRAVEAAEATGESKSRFLRAANHDLRQPLATLRILIFNCLDESDEAARRDICHAMDVSVSIMEDLLGALLQIGQLDAGKIVARVTTFQLSQLFDRLDLQFGHLAAEKGLELRFVQPRGAVVTDKALLERILSNLVANAIRYTEVGRVLVGCRRAGDALRIEVWDTGRGIAPEDRGRIFDEFFQAPDARRAKRPGLGLGLNIVQRLADLLGHPVDVRSVPGRGSVFSVSVPLGDVWHSEPAEPEITEMLGGEFAGTPVLLVEDDQVLRDATRELLERWGMRVSAVASQREMRAHLLAGGAAPALIIADYSLRGQFGTAMVREARRILGAEVPAVIVTADAAPDVVAQVAEAGLPLMIKPVSPPRLRVMMHNLLFEPHEVSAGRERR